MQVLASFPPVCIPGGACDPKCRMRGTLGILPNPARRVKQAARVVFGAFSPQRPIFCFYILFAFICSRILPHAPVLAVPHRFFEYFSPFRPPSPNARFPCFCRNQPTFLHFFARFYQSIFFARQRTISLLRHTEKRPAHRLYSRRAERTDVVVRTSPCGGGIR